MYCSSKSCQSCGLEISISCPRTRASRSVKVSSISVVVIVSGSSIFSMIDYGVMANPAHQPVFTSSDYLAWEEEQLERHEFVDGEVFAMAGAEDKHVTVSGNLHAALHYHLRSSPCRTYASDMRLHVEKTDAYFYPDVFVTCSKKDLESSKVKTEPIFVAEVLSPSTAATPTATAKLLAWIPRNSHLSTRRF